MFGPIVYIIGVLTSAACAALLMRGYIRGKEEAPSLERSLFHDIVHLKSAHFCRLSVVPRC